MASIDSVDTQGHNSVRAVTTADRYRKSGFSPLNVVKLVDWTRQDTDRPGIVPTISSHSSQGNAKRGEATEYATRGQDGVSMRSRDDSSTRSDSLSLPSEVATVDHRSQRL